MRIVALLAVATGCTFHGPQRADDPGVDAAVVAPSPDAPGVATPDAPAANVACATSDTTGLVACYELDENFAASGTVHDSSANHLDATTDGLLFIAHDAAGAAEVTPASWTYVPQTHKLDLPDAFTLALWVHPSSLPGGGKVFGLLDHEDQYAMALGTSSGETTSRCLLTGVSEYEWVDGIAPDRWSMLACTWDGTVLCAYRWTSPTSHTANCFEPFEAPSAAGTHGLAIGSLSTGGTPHDRLDGDLDGIHLFDRALTEAALCTAVGQGSGCM